MLGISDVLKLQLLGNKNIIFDCPDVELEMQNVDMLLILPSTNIHFTFLLPN